MRIGQTVAGQEMSWSPTDLAFRPVWLGAWIGMSFGAIALLAGALGWGILAYTALALGIGAWADANEKPNAFQWVASGLAAAGSTFAYALGVSALLAGTFDPISIGITGVLCLILLIWFETIAISAEAASRSRKSLSE